MQDGKLEFECVGLTNNGKFPLQHTGRGEDKSPEFNLKSSAGKRHLLKAIEPHIIQRGEIVVFLNNCFFITEP